MKLDLSLLRSFVCQLLLGLLDHLRGNSMKLGSPYMQAALTLVRRITMSSGYDVTYMKDTIISREPEDSKPTI